jgi:hypothetical protein
VISDDHFGLLAAVSRIAAILPNDLAPTNMNGRSLRPRPMSQLRDKTVVDYFIDFTKSTQSSVFVFQPSFTHGAVANSL